MTTVRVRATGAEALLPGRQRPGDAGLDLRAAGRLTIEPGARAVVGTGVRIALPAGSVGLVRDRSGLARDHGLHVLAGVIDANYRGEIKIVLVNLGRSPFRVSRGDRIAQLLVLPVLEVEITPVAALGDTERREAGFGSTGLK